MSHSHGQSHNKPILLASFLLTLLFALLEIAFGFFTQSLALLSEGIHMLSDGISLLLGFVAVTVGLRAATRKHSFGFRRLETIAAFLNGLALLVIPVFVFWEALQRFLSPRDIAGSDMLLIASIGLVINLTVAFLLSRGDRSSLNIRAAALHVLSDLLSSVATIIAALAVMYAGWTFVDPLVSAAVSVVIFAGGVKITKEAFGILMEASPPGVDLSRLEANLQNVPGVASIDVLRVWSIASDVHYAAIHVTAHSAASFSDVLTGIQGVAKEYHLHETVQLSFLKKNKEAT